MGEKQTSTHFKRFYDPVTEIKSRNVSGIIMITMMMMMIIIIIINAMKYG
jgi:heme/copper-type cytochrome/quinol oxidase subunit 2